MVIGGVPILFVGLFWAYNPNISVIVDYMLMAKEISSGYILTMSMPVDFNFTMKMAFVKIVKIFTKLFPGIRDSVSILR